MNKRLGVQDPEGNQCSGFEFDLSCLDLDLERQKEAGDTASPQIFPERLCKYVGRQNKDGANPLKAGKARRATSCHRYSLSLRTTNTILQRTERTGAP